MRKSYRIKRKKQFIEQKRKEKMKRQQEEYSYDNVFSFAHFLETYPKCLTGVGWKASAQLYQMDALTKLYNDYSAIHERKLPSPVSSRSIIIRERGKERVITPIHVKDRIIQKVLCNYSLIPLLSPKLIYDNGASLTGKGIMFTRNRIYKHLQNAKKKFGTDFYILQFDFKHFFESIPHATCQRILEKYILDKEIVKITMDIIKCHQKQKYKNEGNTEMLHKLDNNELCGMCLGSQVSQIMALIIANELDHYIKDVRKFKYYCRYMDDGVIIAETKQELKELYGELNIICERLGLRFNENKTQIKKITRGFTFLKVKYFIRNNKICRVLTHKGIVRMRRKLKKFKPMVERGEISLDNVYDSLQSWLAHAKVADSYKTVKNILKLYNELYDGYRITKKWRKYHVLQNNK